MKTLIAIAFLAAAGSAGLGHAGLLSPTSIVPFVCFGAALILVLLHLMNVGDRRAWCWRWKSCERRCRARWIDQQPI
jgi:hypothetical protein